MSKSFLVELLMKPVLVAGVVSLIALIFLVQDSVLEVSVIMNKAMPTFLISAGIVTVIQFYRFMRDQEKQSA